MDMANQFLSLSLFIMLLSFFIILNSVSNFDVVKSRPVLSSVATAFSNKRVEEKLLPDATPAPEKTANEGDSLDKLEKLFNANIAGSKIERNRLGTIMHVRLPVEDFTQSITASAINNASSSFLPTLVSLIKTKDSDVQYRMDMVFNTQESAAVSANNQPKELQDNIKVFAKTPETLQRLGLPKKLFSYGVAKGDPAFIDIYFRRYQPFTLKSEGE